MNDQLSPNFYRLLAAYRPFHGLFIVLFSFVLRKMNAQQPPPYGQPAPNDQDEDEAKMSVLWGRIQGFFILVALIITLAELGLVVQNRGLAHKALGMAKGADGTATDQVSL